MVVEEKILPDGNDKITNLEAKNGPDKPVLAHVDNNNSDKDAGIKTRKMQRKIREKIEREKAIVTRGRAKQLKLA